MTAKTITLTGAEIRAGYSGGANAWLRNDGTDVIYAAAVPGITAGSDGVVSIPAGQSAPVYGAYGTVYLLGTGSVQLIGSDYSTNPFKTSAQSGGSGADSVARAAINQHAGNADIHVTAAQKSAWDALSNPNLLINPDFAINQRGQNEYSSGYTVDGWYIEGTKCSVRPSVDGILITSAIDPDSNTHAFWQKFENPFAPGNYTISLNVLEVSGNWSVRVRTVDSSGVYKNSYYTEVLQAGINKVSVNLPKDEYISHVSIGILVGTEVADTLKVEWIKLETGETATVFMPPDPVLELLKSQRYYQIRTTNDIDPLDLRPSMGTITDIKAVEGGYAYVAEL